MLIKKLFFIITLINLLVFSLLLSQTKQVYALDNTLLSSQETSKNQESSSDLTAQASGLPAVPGVSEPTNFASYVKYIYLLMLYAIGLTAFGVLVYAGFLYMLADTVVSKEDAKKWFFGAISGLILALAAYLILNTINPDLVNWQVEVGFPED